MRKPEQLKVELFSRGMRVSPGAERAITRGGKVPASMRDYVTTGGIILRLPGDVYVNAPAYEKFCENSPIQLDVADHGLVLVQGEERIPAEHIPIPSYLLEKNRDGVPYRDFAVSHTDRVRLAPIAGCAFRCTFCDLPYTFDYTTKRIDHMVDAVLRALSDPVLPSQHVLVSGGTPTANDRSYFRETLRAVCRATKAPVDVMMVPWRAEDFLSELHTTGVEGVFFNMEVFGEAIARKVMPQKAAYGRNDLLSCLKQAVPLFGERKVRSLLLVGLEPIEDLLAGVEALASNGIVPVLSPFRPSPDTPLRDVRPPTSEVLMAAHDRALEICRRYGLPLGPECVPCQHNTLTMPSSR